MFAALYRLLALETPPSEMELSALGFEIDPRFSTADLTHPEELVSQGEGREDKSPVHGIVPASADQPDWSFPLVIVKQRKTQDLSGPEQHLHGIQPFNDADDSPLGECPETIPLFSHAALSRTLLQEITRPQLSGRIDARRLCERVAARRPLMPIPKKQRDEPIQQFWVLMDYLPELAWDISYLQQQFVALPLQQRPLRQLRLSHDASGFFDENDNLLSFSQMPLLPDGMVLLVVGNPLSPSDHLRRVLRKLSPHRPLVRWLSPAPHSRAIYWGENRVSVGDTCVVEQMKTLLWPFPQVPHSMVRECRLALGGSTAAEQSFLLSVTEHSNDLFAGVCTVHQDMESNQQKLLTWLNKDPTRVGQLYGALKPHIAAMTATFRHRAVLNLPDALASVQEKIEATDFFESLAQRVEIPSTNVRHLSAVIMQMASDPVNMNSSRLSAIMQIGQQAYSQFDKNSAMQIANASSVLSHDTVPGWLSINSDGLELTDEGTAGAVLGLDVSEVDGIAVQMNGQRRLAKFGSTLPSSDFTIYSPTEHIELIQQGSHNFHFAESVQQNESGVQLTTQEQLGIKYPVGGGGPLFNTKSVPNWLQTCQLGIDSYGLWSELELAGIGVKMRWIAPGRFQMGSPESEAERRENERQHWVNLTDGYWLAETACTQGLWEAVMGENPSHFKGTNRPVDSVSWDDVQAFLKALSVMQGGELKLALPSEAQWEYACRAGTNTAFNAGRTITPEQVNYGRDFPYADAAKSESRKPTIEVKSFEPNDWGLYQMHGNVYEWCSDRYGEYSGGEETNPAGAETGANRVLRGGSWGGHAQYCRSASRNGREPSGRDSLIGFRFAQVTKAPVDAERPVIREKAEARRSRDSHGRASP